jgi:hypothetical protein
MAAFTPEQLHLRTRCGLPPLQPAMTPDLDDPAQRELTTAQAAEAAHVSEDVIRGWARASRGLIHNVAGPGEQPRCIELEVLRAEAHTRRTARRTQLLAEAAQMDAPSN